jgi:excisionase family DNA binding protein
MHSVTKGESMRTPLTTTPEQVKTFLAKKGDASTLPTLVTAKQLAVATQIAESTIYQWVHLGYIPHIRLGRCVRFNLVEVQAWLQQHTRTGRKERKIAVEVE